jgi:hypothetical protein
MKNNMKYFLTLLMIYAAVIGYAQTDTTQSTADKIIEGNKVKIILKEKQVVKINTEGKDTLVNRVESINIVTKGNEMEQLSARV